MRTRAQKREEEGLNTDDEKLRRRGAKATNAATEVPNFINDSASVKQVAKQASTMGRVRDARLRPVFKASYKSMALALTQLAIGFPWVRFTLSQPGPEIDIDGTTVIHSTDSLRHKQIPIPFYGKDYSMILDIVELSSVAPGLLNRNMANKYILFCFSKEKNPKENNEGDGASWDVGIWDVMGILEEGWQDQDTEMRRQMRRLIRREAECLGDRVSRVNDTFAFSQRGRELWKPSIGTIKTYHIDLCKHDPLFTGTSILALAEIISHSSLNSPGNGRLLIRTITNPGEETYLQAEFDRADDLLEGGHIAQLTVRIIDHYWNRVFSRILAEEGLMRPQHQVAWIMDYWVCEDSSSDAA